MTWWKRAKGKLSKLLFDPRAVLTITATRILFHLGFHEPVIFRGITLSPRMVLFVCKGNVCRSPLAHFYFAGLVSSMPEPPIVCSAGIEAAGGEAANPAAMAVAERHGLSLRTHVTSRITNTMVEKADVIIVMEVWQKRQVITQFPEARGKVFLLGYFTDSLPAEIDDPYGGSDEDFERCFKTIRDTSVHLCCRLLGSPVRLTDRPTALLSSRCSREP